ncbi:metallo-beta-lactamase superfamily protein [Amylocarpus encephaloides]|uniref:Metallo-beta-lactamase superfamily protein n=1 Tax=Amylocarpus encephaloides TaxID=45428 RepID=A0A9P7Y8J6_9HELO|nr:metallo-beta-lactamase superfamily protein [Amylocarpus encephaloides]
MSISIEILQTGSVRLRPSAYSQPANHSVLSRRLKFLTDRTWHPNPLPVFSFLVHHPEGPILFDTGMSPSCNSPGYFPRWAPAIKWTSELLIEPHEGIVKQLREKGVKPQDLKAVVISHLHHDHAGGLKDLEDAPIYTSRTHWESFKNPIFAALEGAAPSHWPKTFPPLFLDPSGPPIGPFERSYPITADGRVVAVDTPGHTRGHVSLVVFGEGTTWFLTGDACFSLQGLDGEGTDGLNDDPKTAVETVRRIKGVTMGKGKGVVVLPSHDWGSVEWLRDGTVYKPTKLS